MPPAQDLVVIFPRNPSPAIAAGLVQLAHVLSEDPALRAWFMSMEMFPAPARSAAFMQMAKRMKATRKDAELAAAVAALVRPEVYDALRASVAELCSN